MAGCAQPQAPLADTDLAGGTVAVVERLDLPGRIIHYATGEFGGHTKQTEEILMPYQQVGFKVDVPEGVTELEITLAWEGGGALMIDTHSHHPDSHMCCVIHSSPLDDDNPKCIRIPAEDARPGLWEPMIRGDPDLQTDFVLSVVTVGGKAVHVEGPHGHDRVAEVNNREDLDRPVEPCVRWTPP